MIVIAMFGVLFSVMYWCILPCRSSTYVLLFDNVSLYVHVKDVWGVRRGASKID